MKIVFMGTPDFAVPSLQKLAKHHDVVGVITAPDKPAGRGKKLKGSAVKTAAEELGLHILQPTNLKDPEFVEALRNLGAELFVVLAFRMLPEVVWAMPAKGTINLHASLLPMYRGAAPINRAIMNGETESGLSTFFIEKEIDTGHVIDQVKMPIGPDETAGELHDRMMDAGADLLLKTVNSIENGEADGKPQADFGQSELKEAPKIFKEDCRIDWSLDSLKVHNHIRGLSPYPAAWTEAENLESKAGNTFKILAGKKVDDKNLIPGDILIDDNRWFVGCGRGAYEILEIQAPGKKRMPVADFLRGFRPEEGFRFVV